MLRRGEGGWGIGGDDKGERRGLLEWRKLEYENWGGKDGGANRLFFKKWKNLIFFFIIDYGRCHGSIDTKAGFKFQNLSPPYGTERIDLVDQHMVGYSGRCFFSIIGDPGFESGYEITSVGRNISPIKSQILK